MWHAEGRSLLAVVTCSYYAAWPKIRSYPTLWLVPNETHMRAAGTNGARDDGVEMDAWMYACCHAGYMYTYMAVNMLHNKFLTVSLIYVLTCM